MHDSGPITKFPEYQTVHWDGFTCIFSVRYAVRTAFTLTISMSEYISEESRYLRHRILQSVSGRRLLGSEGSTLKSRTKSQLKKIWVGSLGSYGGCDGVVRRSVSKASVHDSAFKPFWIWSSNCWISSVRDLPLFLVSIFISIPDTWYPLEIVPMENNFVNLLSGIFLKHLVKAECLGWAIFRVISCSHLEWSCCERKNIRLGTMEMRGMADLNRAND